MIQLSSPPFRWFIARPAEIGVPTLPSQHLLGAQCPHFQVGVVCCSSEPRMCKHLPWAGDPASPEFSVLGRMLTPPGLPPVPAGSGNAERRREKNGNASTAGRAARPPPVTVSVPVVTGSEKQGWRLWGIKKKNIKTGYKKTMVRFHVSSLP